MLEKIKKIPAGTFLVPMFISMVLYTLWPNLFKIGGISQSLLAGEGQGFIIGLLCFCSGVGIDLKRLVRVLKRQGILFLVKLGIAFLVTIAYLRFFGDGGIWGMPAIAVATALLSINPAIYLSISEDYGNEDDPYAFGLTSLFCIPLFPIIIFGLVYSSGGFDWMPVISTLLPMLLGIILGNLDKQFAELFGPGLNVLIPWLGWSIGQGTNVLEAIKAGPTGILLTLMVIIFMSPLFLVDYKILGNDGTAGLAMLNVAGLSTSVPVVLATTYPQLLDYQTAAVSQILASVVILSFLSPVLTERWVNHLQKKEAE